MLQNRIIGRLFTSSALLALTLNAVGLSTRPAFSAATATTYIGPAAPASWLTPGNWSAGVPVDNTWQAIFTTAVDFTATTGIPASLNQISTGAGLVQFPVGFSLPAGSGFTPNGGVNIGSGGATFGGTFSLGNGGSFINAAGNLTLAGMGWGNTGTITQTGGTFSIPNFVLPLAGAVSIPGYVFSGTTPTTISSGSSSANYTFTGTPTFAGGHRPNWNVDTGFSTGTSGVWNLAGFTMTGNTVNVTASGSPNNRYSALRNTVGGAQIDANVLNVGNATYAAPYLDFTAAATVTLRGVGTIYNNFSVNNDGTGKTVAAIATTWPRAFKADTSTFVLDPAAGSASIDTGSTDSGTSGFTNNFALGNVTIATGDTVTLSGNQNLGGSANNALYVAGTLRGENAATLTLATRNAYVNGQLQIGNSPGTFTINNGGLHLTSNALAEFELNGPNPGTDYDQLVLTGTTILNLNNANLVIDLTAGVGSGGLFFLANNQTANAINGIFAGLPQGSAVNLVNPLPSGILTAFISYQGDYASGSFLGGNDIVLQLSIVPEPSTLALLGLGIVGMAVKDRRRRNAAA